MKKFLLTGCLVCIFFNLLTLTSPLVFAQSVSESVVQSVDDKITDKHYTFEPQIAIPTGGRTIQLTGEFDFTISGDTLSCNLPYYGRAYMATNPSDGGYKFTTVNYQYKITKPNEDEWIIDIAAMGRTQNEKFMLTAYRNGNASLVVTSNNRQPILFRGLIR